MSDIRANALVAETATYFEQDARPAIRQKSRPAAPHDEFVTFMHNRVACDACQTLLRLGKTEPSNRLHVLISGEHLVVTAVDDLHQAGRVISGRRVAEFPRATIFELDLEPAPGTSPLRHRAAVGCAVLILTRRGRRLIASGVVDRSTCDHDSIFDAIEMR